MTFVLPCYKLGRYLPNCINSILEQTFENFEILIVDDCSPDNTAAIGGSFTDRRVHYLRNECNLGHLRNYNKGISLARGEFVWLISPDDALRDPCVLARYVAVLDDHPKAGFACCPVFEVDDHGRQVKGIYAPMGREDRVFPAHNFLKLILQWSAICPAATMVRKAVYEEFNGYPLDLPYSGDWYLWCLFALKYDVAYFGEPMVAYRHHDMAMTVQLRDNDLRICAADCLAIPLRIRRLAEGAGFEEVVRQCDEAFLYHAVEHFESRRAYRGKTYNLTIADLVQFLDRDLPDRRVRNRLMGKVLCAAGDEAYWSGRFTDAEARYAGALDAAPTIISNRLKYWLLRCGRLGIACRAALGAARRLNPV